MTLLGQLVATSRRVAETPGRNAKIAALAEFLRMLAPAERPILWPEHFDVGITVARVNYGLSPGDAAIDEPYAYVGPWEPASYEGAFWNAPFGAAQRLTGLGGVAAVLAFFREGQRLTS